MSSSTSEETISSHSSSISLNQLMNFSRYNLGNNNNNNNNNIEFDYRMADTLSSTILQLWSSSIDCDLVFLISNRRYYAHSSILLNVCRSLENYFINIKSSTIKYTCQLKITPYHGLELLLIYIYTSRLILNIYTISDLFLAASELDVEHIIQRCIQFINESIQKMYDKSEKLSFLWSYLKCCLLIPTIHHVLYERIIQAIKYFYPQIISSKRFLSLTPKNLIQIFELLFPNNISSSILYNSLINWATFTDQSNRQIIIEYLILKYLNHLNLSNNNSNLIISNKFYNMEKKLYELINYQKNILNRLDKSIIEIESNDSLELNNSSYCLIPHNSIKIKSSQDETLWITESEETINSSKNSQYLWNINHKKITTIAICCTLQRNRQEINKDFQQALYLFNQFDSSEQKYAFIHVGKFLYAIGEYKTKMFKFNIISHNIQHIDGPYPGRSQFGLAATINYIILIGGLITEQKSISSNILFNCKQEQWCSLPNLPLRYQQGIFLPGVCFIDHCTIIVVGGLIMTSEGPIAMRKCFRLNLNQRKWLSIASCNEARGQPIVTYYSDMIYTIGGLQYIYDKYKIMTSINVISIEQYNIYTNQWTILTTLNQLQYQKNLYCTSDAILIGTDKKNKQWSYNLIKQHLTCNLGLSA
ncbi:unnamed protein product [Rotaria sordida]|uniref:BTB domain-containing protein n=2 Tax=Rotaria sordida TaxID=392033 RepID=A0A819CU70_9BILA|nr:unnamed protein product [Rotaria sordida]